MQVVGGAESRPVPGKGRISAVCQGKAVEAWLELPCAETRSHIKLLPLVAWVTVGLLAQDLFALQVGALPIKVGASCAWGKHR